MSLLKVKDLTVRYKRKIAIKSINFEAEKGEILGFIGADGAGKSSIFHAISGVLKFEGEIVYNGIVYHSPQEAEKIKPFAGLMPQGIGLVLYPNLSVDEHLDFFSKLRDVKQNKIFEEYKERLLHMAGLLRFKKRLAKNLSGGMKQKLSLICTLIHKPKLLILDEPTTGVDPLSRRELWEILDENRKKENTLTLFSTAYMAEAAKMDRIFLIDSSEIIASGKAYSLIESAKAYTYIQTECEKCLSFNNRTYSLRHLNAPYAEPTLESLFFINALKKGKLPPPVDILPREKSVDIPSIVMEAKGVTKKFGNFIANDKIDVKLKRGEILGLLGANGAGKTTFIKSLLGLYKIDGGELYLLGKKIRSSKDREDLKSKIGYMSQNFSLYKDMTIYENLLYFASLHGVFAVDAVKKIETLANSLGFEKDLNSFPVNLPLGITQRFSLAAAILHEPVVLFLDEPTSGVDTIARAQFWQLMHKIKKLWNISILITTHYMSEAQYCDRVVVLKNGKKIEDDTPLNLYNKYPNAKNFEDIFFEIYKENR